MHKINLTRTSKTKYKKALAITILLCLLLPQQSFASAISLNVTPTNIQVHLAKNGTLSQSIFLENTSDSTLDLNLTLRPFLPSDKNDGSIIYPKNDKDLQPTVNFIEKSVSITQNQEKINKITLAPKQKSEIKVSFDIDRYKEIIKDHNFSLLLTTDSEKNINVSDSEEKNVNAKTYVSFVFPVHIFVDANNQIPSRVDIENFSTPSFIQKGPVPFSLILKNNASKYINIYGNISIYNMFGQKIITLKLNPTIILAGAQRDILMTESIKNSDISSVGPIQWNVSQLLGWYTARVDLANDNAEEIQTTNNSLIFYAIPLTRLIAFLIIFFIIAYLGKKLIKYSQ